jgi:beta-lactam-binding protein with PASTA domain
VYDEESYQYAPPPKSPIPVAALTSVITTILVFFGLRLLEDRGLFAKGPTATTVEVPSVLGIRPEQAREVLRGRELVVALAGEREDPRVAPGAISAQTPPPGTPAPRGSTVQVTTARAAAAAGIPNLAGLRGEDAVRHLTGAGYQIGAQKTAPSPTVPAGAVIQTEPPAGTAAPPGSVVVLVLSTGGTPSAIPRVLGMRMTRARKVIEEAGFRVGRVRIGSNDDRMGGVILKQDPPEGTPAPPGSNIDLVVNED